jgi:hypothetical protein
MSGGVLIMGKRSDLGDAASWFIELLTADDLDQIWPEFERWIDGNKERVLAFEWAEQGWSAGERAFFSLSKRHRS